jgi:chaperone protein EcpD
MPSIVTMTSQLPRHAFAWICILLFLSASPVHAGVVIDTTRVIYLSSAREISVRITNQGDQPSLVQAWLDAGDEKAAPGDQPTPFILTPPIFRLDAKAAQSVRIAYTQEPLPTDRESLFWLNVLDIPPKPDGTDDKSYLQLTVRSRIKMFFRPKAVRGNTEQAASTVTWMLAPKAKDAERVLQVFNPSPFYLTFVGVSIGEGAGRLEQKAAFMVAPMTSAEIELTGTAAVQAGAALTYNFLNDYGVSVSGAAVVAPRNE